MSILEQYRERAKLIYWMGKRVEDMDREQLLGVIGFAVDRLEQERASHKTTMDFHRAIHEGAKL